MGADWDAVVIGTGPAGMAATATLAEGGARTLAVNEQPEIGGQIYRSIERSGHRPELTRILGADYLHGASLADRLRSSGAEMPLGTLVWRIDDESVWMRNDEGVDCVRARAVAEPVRAPRRPSWVLAPG